MTSITYVPSQYSNVLLLYTRRFEVAKIRGWYCGMSETGWYWWIYPKQGTNQEREHEAIPMHVYKEAILYIYMLIKTVISERPGLGSMFCTTTRIPLALLFIYTLSKTDSERYLQKAWSYIIKYSRAHPQIVNDPRPSRWSYCHHSQLVDCMAVCFWFSQNKLDRGYEDMKLFPYIQTCSIIRIFPTWTERKKRQRILPYKSSVTYRPPGFRLFVPVAYI